MDLLQIRVFTLVAKYGSFSQAADYLYMSQSSTSKYVSSLESELGFSLFNRAGKSVTLTKFGEEFFPYAQSLLNAETEANDFVNTHRRSKTHWSIGLTDDISDGSFFGFYRAFINAVHRFGERYPDIGILARIYPSQELFTLIRQNKVDCGIVPVSTFNFQESFPPSGSYYCLDHIQNALVLADGIRTESSYEELGQQIKTLYYVINDVNQKHVLQLIGNFRSAPKLVPCHAPMELVLRMSANIPSTAALIDQNLIHIFSDIDMHTYPLDPVQFGSGLFMVWEKTVHAQEFPLFCECIREYLDYEDRFSKMLNTTSYQEHIRQIRLEEGMLSHE